MRGLRKKSGAGGAKNACITQIAAGKKQIRLGDVSPTRDFNYVLDTCRGFVALAESDKTIGGWSIYWI